MAAVKFALQQGIRHIDTASIYKVCNYNLHLSERPEALPRNEHGWRTTAALGPLDRPQRETLSSVLSPLQNETEIGNAVRDVMQEGFLSRKDIFITSKISPYEQGTAAATDACHAMLQRLGLDYLDLLLIHWPGVAKEPLSSPLNAAKRRETWQVLEDMHAKGVARWIGVSNYEQRHLEELLTYARVRPAINQVECHPRWPQDSLREYCAAQGIQVVAYSSFGAGALLDPDEAPEVATVAASSGKSPAVVLLCWGLQKGCSVLPKSCRPERIAEWCSLAMDAQGRWLTIEEEALLDGMGSTPERQKKYCWDPSAVT